MDSSCLWESSFTGIEALRGSLFGPTQLFPGSVTCREGESGYSRGKGTKHAQRLLQTAWNGSNTFVGGHYPIIFVYTCHFDSLPGERTTSSIPPVENFTRFSCWWCSYLFLVDVLFIYSILAYYGVQRLKETTLDLTVVLRYGLAFNVMQKPLFWMGTLAVPLLAMMIDMFKAWNPKGISWWNFGRH